MEETKPKLGSTEETNRLLGGKYFNPADGKQIKPFKPKVSNTPTVITSESLKDAKPMEVVNPAPALETAGFQGFIESQTQARQDDFTRRQEQLAQSRGTQADQSFDALFREMTSTPGETELTARRYAQKGGVDDIQRELDDINQQILSEQNALRRQIERIEKNEQGMFGGAVQDRIDEVTRESLRKQADLSIIQMGVQGRYDSAKAIADRAIAVQLERQANRNAALQLTYERNQDLFTKEEQRAFESAQADRERKLEEERENKTRVYDLAIDAQRNGAPASLVSQAMRAKTPEEANALVGSYVGLLDRQKLRAEAQEAQAEAQLTLNAGNAVVGEYGSVINTAANLLGAEKAKQSRKDIAAAIANGDYTNAYANIANNVEQALTGENKTKFANARTDYAVMARMRDAIKEYADAGGNMNLLVGTEESIKRKLGIDSGEATELAVQLWREYQTYRSNMTGAAFSPAESRDYASVNPTLGKSLNLNLSVIDGAMNGLEDRIVATIDTRVPGAEKIYNLANGVDAEEVEPETAPVGSIIDFGGVQYRVLGNNQFEEI